MYFLGLQGAMPGSQRATMRRAVIVSAAVSAGFLSVFLVAGVISYNFTSWINENAKYATGGIGVALLVSALTIALASANTGLLKLLRGSLQYVDRIAAFFVLLSGFYLLWYFYWVDIKEDGDPITDWALERQAQATAFLTDHWQVVGLVMIVIVGGAMAYAWSRPNAAIDAPAAPVDEPSSPGTA